MTPAEISLLLSDVANVRIAIVGDLMLDSYTWGRVDRISPEAPVPVVEITRHTTSPGGAANAAACVAALGAQAVVYGSLGADAAGERLLVHLAELGVESHCTIAADERTTTKHRIWGGSQQLLRVDTEARLPTGVSLGRLADRFVASGYSAVLMSDYGKGVLDRESCAWLIEQCRGADVPTVLDPKSVNFEMYRGVAVIKPNEREAARAFMNQNGADGTLEEVAEFLLELADAAVVTRGSAGIELFEREGHVHLPVHGQSVYDVTGAGDVVAAVLSVGQALQWPMRDACRLANAAARISVGRAGTGGVTLADLIDDVEDEE